MHLKYIFGENVKFYRKQNRLSQQKFAELCEIVPNYVSEIENGKKFPSAELIERISQVLNVSPYVFFVNSNEISNIKSELFSKELSQKQNENFAEELLESIQKILSQYGFNKNRL